MDIETLRIKSDIVALDILVTVLTKYLQVTDPLFTKLLRDATEHATNNFNQLTIKDYSPEEADLIAGEFQESWERLLKQVLVEPQPTRRKRSRKPSAVTPGHSDAP